MSIASNQITLSFKYPTLKAVTPSVRVLQILPESSEDGIKCVLGEVELSKTHTCLSYTWGSDEPTNIIIVNSQQLLVRDNLHAFLKECVRRQRLVSEPLWIDAICINQGDIPEKNIQVSRMGEIYEQAKEVIIWLGAGQEDIEAAFDRVKAYADSPLTSDALAQEAKHSSTDVAGNSIKVYWDTYDLISQLPYWRRMWIVQELLQAEEVSLWYGSRALQLIEFLDYTNFIWGRPGPPRCSEHIGGSKIVRSSCGWLVRRWASPQQRSGQRLDFQSCFAQLRRQLCHDPRDFVYALRALDEKLKCVPVEYEKDLVFFMPMLLDKGLLTSEVSHAGLLILQRFNLTIEEVIERTSVMLEGRTWDIIVDQIGIMARRSEGLCSDSVMWKVDWSACRTFSRGASAIYDDHIEDLELQLASNNTVGFKDGIQIQQGDLAVRFHWLSLVLIFRNHNQPTSPPSCTDHVQNVRDDIPLYTFLTAFTIDPCHRHRSKPYLAPRKMGPADPLLVRPSVFHDFYAELRNIRIEGPSISGLYRTKWTWPSLLRVWELKKEGLLTWRIGGFDPIGSWDEEAAKAANASGKE